MGALIFTGIMFVGIYFFLIRPQQARVRSHQALVASVQVGDEVVTAGGIVGIVTAISERDVMVEVSPGVELKVVKGAIAQKAPDTIEAGE
ncbi:MAG: preprotein translocase subunit YajC [Actinobacteria bacterium]|nr:preprotein translocase subunit YajC [Actinomycetota bacterium]